VGHLESTASFVAADTDADANYVSIRGRRVNLNELVNPRLFDPSYLEGIREKFRSASPFPHLVIEDWFSPDLLSLALEEFNLSAPEDWRDFTTSHEQTIRWRVGARLGPASQIYFGIVNSGWFVDLLSQVTSVPDLLPDPHLFGGGLHETRNGGHFGVHRDFDVHVRTGLRNEMVLLTYLNHNWDSSWDADLELWDERRHKCIKSVSPEFGRSILMRHGRVSFHGHPRPMRTPDGVARRSLATYYYTNQHAEELRSKRISSVFLKRVGFLHNAGKRLTPPILWDFMKRMKESL
jgi:2OG-Fe(II) oxygenase superfamily